MPTAVSKWWSAPGLLLNVIIAFAAMTILGLSCQKEAQRVDSVIEDVSALLVRGVNRLRASGIQNPYQGVGASSIYAAADQADIGVMTLLSRFCNDSWKPVGLDRRTVYGSFIPPCLEDLSASDNGSNSWLPGRETILSLFLARRDVNPEQLALSYTSRLRPWLEESTQYLRYRSIHWLWGVLYILYIGVVAVGYHRRVISADNSESLLNVVDLGFILHLITYTGGLRSNLLPVLSISVCLVIVEMQRRGGILTAWADRESSEGGFVGFLVPALLYVVAGVTGLIWSSVHGLAEGPAAPVVRIGLVSVLYSMMIGLVGILLFALLQMLFAAPLSKYRVLVGWR
jgi:hypothetical protein